MERPTRLSQSVRFGPFELEVQSGELRKDGVKIRLQEQPFQILLLLLEYPGQVVTREAFRRRLWPSDTFVDFDHGLNKAVTKLREALGDSSENPQFIETLAKRGYRFIGRTAAITDLPEAGQSIDSIAVFPFESDSPDPDSGYLAIGIPGSIIHSLSQIPKLRVISGRTAVGDGHPQMDPLAIGRKLGVKAVLTGKLWQRESKLRLHVDLLNTANGQEIWGEQYDRQLKQIFEVHDEISHEVSQRLRLKMTGEAEGRLTKRYTENIEAYQLYVRARRWCEKRSAEGFKRATEYLSQAIQMDPDYALAHAELAQCISVPCYYGVADPHMAYPKARAAALRALEIDPRLAEAHEVLATILQNYDWNWPAAEKEYKQTIELNPNYAVGHYHYSYHLALLRHFDEAIRQATEALSHDPMSGILNAGLAFVLLLARRYDACIEQALTAIEVEPNMTLCYITLGTAYEQKGMYADAVTTYEKGIALGGAFAVQRAYAGHVYGVSGDRIKAGEILRELKELSSRSYVGSLNWALVYEGLGEKELAIGALQKACEDRHTICVFIGTWPQFDRLRDDPRFQDIERRVGLRK